MDDLRFRSGAVRWVVVATSRRSPPPVRGSCSRSCLFGAAASLSTINAGTMLTASKTRLPDTQTFRPTFPAEILHTDGGAPASQMTRFQSPLRGAGGSHDASRVRHAPCPRSWRRDPSAAGVGNHAHDGRTKCPRVGTATPCASDGGACAMLRPCQVTMRIEQRGEPHGRLGRSRSSGVAKATRTHSYTSSRLKSASQPSTKSPRCAGASPGRRFPTCHEASGRSR